MIIHQLSIFLENKPGRLTDVLEVLGAENIRITALSVADTAEYGILRLIVPEPEKARILLKKHSFKPFRHSKVMKWNQRQLKEAKENPSMSLIKESSDLRKVLNTWIFFFLI